MSINYNFLRSALTEENPYISTDETIVWLAEQNNKIKVKIDKIRFDQLDQWYFNKDRGILQHHTGKFFTIEGIEVETNWGNVAKWQQPIINQPEIGYLGIITREINGILYFLLQAKVEPGNVNNVQLSPTLQATRSNYSQVHKGKKPLYLEYFVNATNDQKLLDQLQSEQGARFLKKRNRNIIIKVDTEVPMYENFVWLTLGQIKKLIRHDNLVNMDTRTVISGIPFGEIDDEVFNFYTSLTGSFNTPSYENKMLRSAVDSSSTLHSFDDILNWFTALKCSYDLEIRPISIFETRNWEITDKEIIHLEQNYFKIIAAKVEISNREVFNWTQPLVEPMQEGLIAFLVKEINGVYHFLIQAKLECGNFDILEMAPTVQCLTGSYKNSKDLDFLNDVLNAKSEQIKFDSKQSEEGGRFYREQNRNVIIEVNDDFLLEVPDNFIWLTLHQLKMFIKFNNYLNIQARSLISAISFL